MPTRHVDPHADEHLEDVAKALLKARKVVVVTGAGISTNSCIPVGTRTALPHSASLGPNWLTFDRTFAPRMASTR